MRTQMMRAAGGLMLIEAVCGRRSWATVPRWTGKVASAELRIP
jgi:hypothetical protein